MKRILALTALVLLLIRPAPPAAALQTLDPSPPAQPVKLIFIHHSTGENWLRDDYGGLGRALAENNYYVSDTNYGWGPDSIGDRTDIPDWLEWFRGARTPAIMQAVYRESGQHSDYTRLFPDPGGENTIILFKSCFPNSDLSGDPDDPPTPGTDFTVGHAKYIYNELLSYFASRPDKLFIVITAPPLSNPSEPENARAFNNWLVHDWLDGYPLSNVAVFDFYNVLTDRDAHHRYRDGRIEHVTGRRDTNAYASARGDDHPSKAGSRKATEEFLPLLNIYYHRWLASGRGEPASPPGPATIPAEATLPAVESPAFSAPGLVADFDAGTPSLNTYRDEQSASRIACTTVETPAYQGAGALQIDFEVTAGSWTLCSLTFDDVQDWSNGGGLRFALRATAAGIPYSVSIVAGSWERTETYLHADVTPSDSVGGWAQVEIPWSDFARVEWESNAGAPFRKVDRVLEMGFGFNGRDEANNAGTIWVDQIELTGAPPGEEGRELPCVGSLLLPGMLLLLGASIRSLPQRLSEGEAPGGTGNAFPCRRSSTSLSPGASTALSPGGLISPSG